MSTDATHNPMLPARSPTWRSRLSRALEAIGVPEWARPRPGSQSAGFTTAFVSLAAKMAKADGVAVLAEEQAFLRFIAVSDAEAPYVAQLWNLAKQDTAGFDLYADRISRLLADEPHVKISVLECLFLVACSDGILHGAEDQFLAIVARSFGVSDQAFRQIRATFVRDRESPYDVLGLAPGASDKEIKARYRALVRELHPDKLQGQGASAALVKAQAAKLASINGAYEAIIKERSKGGAA